MPYVAPRTADPSGSGELVTRARLVDVATPRHAEGVVLVLHGGASRPGSTAVSPTQLSVLRMVPVARRIARAGRRRLSVVRVLNSARGWDTEHTPVADAQWAIDRAQERWPGLPVALVGHSLGGAAALLAGDAAPVRAVVALNPWLYGTEDVDLTGRRVLIVHGTDDRIASPERARRVADRIGTRAEVRWVDVPGGKHAMVRQGSTYERTAADFVVETLLDREARRPRG